ncbi:hypothetical protein DKX38_028607 [Salix brachista]|uniref:ethanolamine-phosphate cytidylyltransferase n=1 Tax=Salix brachista TaxID=2182728 RepID=A0A5N5J6B0_9ROSI|nr:hypothetical protein DKX38_028607 [Salix brachista]
MEYESSSSIWDGVYYYPHLFGGLMLTAALLGLSTSYFGGLGFSSLPYMWSDLGIFHKKKCQKKRIRVYMDGCFDLMHYGHANALRQAKALGDELVVGVVSDEEIVANKGPPVLSMEERLALVSGLKWVDEVIANAPYAITEKFMNSLFNEHKIDYVIHGDDPCLLPDGTDAYALAKKAGRYKQIKRTEGVSSTDIVGRILSSLKDTETCENHDDSSSLPGNALKGSQSNSAHISQFLPTSRRIVQFSNGKHAFPDLHFLFETKRETEGPGPNARVVYIDGAFDLFHAGHVEKSVIVSHCNAKVCGSNIAAYFCGLQFFGHQLSAFQHGTVANMIGSELILFNSAPSRMVCETCSTDLMSVLLLEEAALSDSLLVYDILRSARQLGDFLLVGIHTDQVVSEHRGKGHPIMHLHERSLSVLACRYVDEVIIGAPWEVTKDMVTTFNITLVVHGTVAENNSLLAGEPDPYAVPKSMGIFQMLDSPKTITTTSVAQRIVSNHEAYLVFLSFSLLLYLNEFNVISVFLLDQHSICAFRVEIWDPLSLLIACLEYPSFENVLCFPAPKRNAKKAESEKKYYARKVYVSGD